MSLLPRGPITSLLLFWLPWFLCRRAPGSGLLSAPAASRGCSTGPVPYTSAALGRPHSHGASTGTPPAPRLHLPPKWHLAAFLTSAAQAAPAGHCWSPTAAALMRPLEPPCRQTQEGHPERLAPGLSITASSSAGSRLPAAPTRRWGLIPGPPCSCSSSNPLANPVCSSKYIQNLPPGHSGQGQNPLCRPPCSPAALCSPLQPCCAPTTTLGSRRLHPMTAHPLPQTPLLLPHSLCLKLLLDLYGSGTPRAT